MPDNMELREDLKRKITDLIKTNPLDDMKISIEDKFCGLVPGLKVLTRVKDLDRALEKIDRKGYTNIKQFTDLTGMKIITRNLNDVYEVVDYINRTYSPHSADDYIQQPKASGYRGYHTNFLHNGFNVEVQLQTHAMARASQITHDRFYKQIPGNMTARIVASFKDALPSWLTKPVINTAQRIVFGTVIPFDIVQKQGIKGLYKYMQDLRAYSGINYAPNLVYIHHTVAKAEQKDMSQVNIPPDEKDKLCKSIRENYKEEFSGMKYLSDETALAIKDINAHFGRRLSLNEIKDMRLQIGKDLEQNFTSVNGELFKKLDNIVTDMKLAQNHISNEQLQQQSIQNSVKKDFELHQ